MIRHHRSFYRWLGILLAGALVLLPVLQCFAARESQMRPEPAGSARWTVPAGGSGYVTGEVIVEFKEEAVKAKSLKTAAAEFASGHRALGLKVARTLPHGAALIKTSAGVPEAVAALQRDPRVEYAQPNFIYRCGAINDPLVSWGITHSVYGVQAETAWSYTPGAAATVVAVLDTGVDYGHPDLQDRIIQGYDYVNNDANPMDDNGHGTHVAGIIAATLNNSEGVSGIAPGVKVMAVKVLNAAGTGTTIDVIDGINYAAGHGAKVVNMSFGSTGYGHDHLLYNAIGSYPGSLFVAAAGNKTNDNDAILSVPAGYTVDWSVYGITALPNLVGVAALADPGGPGAGDLASFSNYGETAVGLAAPGEQINSTVPSPPEGGGVALAVCDPVYGDRVMFWGFGAEDLSTADDVYDGIVRTVHDFLGIDTVVTATYPLLVVDDDQSEGGFSDVRSHYCDTLSTAGYVYALYTAPDGADGPAAVDANVYSGLLWFTGAAFLSNPGTANPFVPSTWSPNLTANDRTNLAQYLEGGGKLFLAGRDAGFLIEETSFYQYYLNAAFLEESNPWRLLSLAGMTEPYVGQNYSLAQPSSRYIDVMKPASAKAQTVLTYQPYASASGTSMAAPFVSGAAALLQSVCEVSSDDAIELLRQTVTPAAALASRVASGGTLNAGALLQAAGNKSLALTPTPASGATEVSTTATVKVHANKLISQLDTVKVAVYDGITKLTGITPQLSGNGFDITFSGLTLSYSRTYTVRLAACAVTDFGGQKNDDDFSFSFTTCAAPAGGGGGGGAPPPPPPPAAPEKEEAVSDVDGVITTGEAQSATLLDGKVTLEIPAGALPPAVKVTVKVAAERPVNPPAGLAPLSPVVSIEGAIPAKPVTLRLRYDPLKLGGTDPLCCRVFREEVGGWKPVGGKLARGANEVAVQLANFSNYAVFAVRKDFSDVPGHWAAREVGVLGAREVIGGYPDGSFRPQNSVTRAELAALLAKFLGLKTGNSTMRFNDVTPGAWYAGAIAVVHEKGLMFGAQGGFRPNDTLTREELAAITLRLAELNEQGLPLNFDDTQEVASWARRAVATAAEAGLMRGVAADRFAPKAKVTRAEVAVIMYRLAERLGLYAETVTITGLLAFSNVEQPHWELVTGKDTCVLLFDQADRLITSLVRASEGKTITVTGYPETGPNIYMRGPLIRVVSVRPTQ